VAARIRSARERRGWSQQQLAERAGLTRQLVGAVEAGRQSPSVSAAIALAQVLDTSVEALFGSVDDEIVPAVGAPLPGADVCTARVGDRLVAVPASHRAVNAEQWALSDAVLTASGPEWLPGARSDGLVLAGCDPLLGLLGDLVGRSSRHRIVAAHASTGSALAALGAGTVHGVVVHAADGAFPEPPVPVRRWHVARWAVGLASAAPTGPPSIDELASRRLRVVQREPGAGTQQALQRALRVAGVEGGLPGPVGEGHLDVARRVHAGGIRVGATMEAAARAFGLGFAPLEHHAVELWVDHRWTDLPAVAITADLLADASFLRRAGRLPGYDLAGCGDLLGVG
jgi:DNA-binding XRE family transcriptional regulator